MSRTFEGQPVTEPAAPPSPPSEATASAGVAPWWHAPWRLAVLGVAVAFLAGAVGWVLGSRESTPSPSSVDVGFLQDMRYHHDQAVAMSVLMVKKPLDDGNPTIRVIAEELMLGQQTETGLMVGRLSQWGRAEANESGTAMAWMDHPVPRDRMPGMATQDNLEQLAAARGAAADQLFLQLMIAHHEGGLEMADDAAEHASQADTRDLAAAMARNQRDEIAEMRRYLTP